MNPRWAGDVIAFAQKLNGGGAKRLMLTRLLVGAWDIARQACFLRQALMGALRTRRDDFRGLCLGRSNLQQSDPIPPEAYLEVLIYGRLKRRVFIRK